LWRDRPGAPCPGTGLRCALAALHRLSDTCAARVAAQSPPCPLAPRQPPPSDLFSDPDCAAVDGQRIDLGITARGGPPRIGCASVLSAARLATALVLYFRNVRALVGGYRRSLARGRMLLAGGSIRASHYPCGLRSPPSRPGRMPSDLRTVRSPLHSPVATLLTAGALGLSSASTGGVIRHD